VVVLTKADLCTDVDMFLDSLSGRLPSNIERHAVNATDPIAVDCLAAHLAPGQTVVLLGSSGAGKSTLTNTLTQSFVQKTGPVRTSDSRGRHTTTSRQLCPLPLGGCLIDTPGLRGLRLDIDKVSRWTRHSTTSPRSKRAADFATALITMSRDAPYAQAWRPIDSPTITSSVAKFRAIALTRWRVRRRRLRSKRNSVRCVPCRGSAADDVATRDLIAPIARDRRATVNLAATSLKSRFSQGRGGATAVEKDRQPPPMPEWRN
jgi:energy-coupling factor transporter ATP-binding protein EcfA2